MAEADRKESFNKRSKECGQVTRNVLDFLRTAAEHAGSRVDPPTFEVRGVGITYWTGGKRFCRFDPKPRADHVWALVPSANLVALAYAGTVSEREDGLWVTIRDLRGAVRLVPEILRAYDAATQKGVKRR
jgi:hypothetical protein